MTGPRAAGTGHGSRAQRSRVEFHEDAGVFTGTARGRQWRITQSRTGWRLEFRDKGDTKSTYAGNHATLMNAMTEAGR